MKQKINLLLVGAAFIMSAPVYATGWHKPKPAPTNMGQQQAQSVMGGNTHSYNKNYNKTNSNSKSKSKSSASNNLQLDTKLRNIVDTNVDLVGGSLASTVNGGGTDVSVGGDTNDTIFIPTHTVPVPPSTIPGTQSIQTTSACGPRQELTNNDVVGKYHGLFGTSDVSLGETHGLKSADETFKQINIGGAKALLGHVAVITTTPIAVSGARQFGVGGNGNSGGGASGSLGGSGAMGQVVTNITLVDCVYGKYVVKEVAPKTGKQ